MLTRLLLVFAIVASMSCAGRLSSSGQILQTLHALPANHREIPFVPTKGDSNAQLYYKLVILLEEKWDVDIVEVQDLKHRNQDVYGTFDYITRQLEVRKNIDVNMKLETLLHEAGHFFAPRTLEHSEVDSDAWAESFAYQVMRELGLSMGSQSLVYLSNFQSSWVVLDIHRNYFDHIVAVLVKDLK